jgi:hypothetical protein
MKVIGHTAYGYLMEVTPQEIAKITGKPGDNQHAGFNTGYSRDQDTHRIGTEFKVSETWDHLQRLLKNEPERQRIAESLRAAATLIEHTPSPITIPPSAETEEAKQ